MLIIGQHKTKNHLITNWPLDHCAVVMDFSDNISLVPKDQIENSHWTLKHVTLHPIHIVRHSAESTESEPKLIKKSLIIPSDSLAHNSDAVFVFTKTANATP